MTLNKLSSKEKGQIKRLIYNIQIPGPNRIASATRLRRRGQLKSILLLLGVKPEMIDVRLRVASLDIIKDWKPFKLQRLRKLVNG